MLLALLCVSCSRAEEPGRAGWLRATLIDDNRVDLERSPDLVAQKFRKMSSDPYLYFRGTNGQFYRDMTGAYAPAYPTTVVGETHDILLVGDPHPENVGTYRLPTDELVIEFNDFDAAIHGPFHYDVRRGALGLWTAAVSIGEEAFPEEQRRALVRGFVIAYVAEVRRLDEGGEPYPITRTAGAGTVIDDLFRRARRDGDVREALDEYTRVDGASRQMFVGTVEAPDANGVIGDEVREVDEGTAADVRRLVRQYSMTVVSPDQRGSQFWTTKGVTRRLGAGVSSYPVLRFYVLIEGPSEGADDDVLLEIKEVRDPALLPTLPLLPRDFFENNGQRGVWAQRLLHLRPDSDALLGWAGSSSQAFRVRQRTKYQKNVGVDRMAEKIAQQEWNTDVVFEFAKLMGRLLARTHFQSTTRTGNPAGPLIAASLSDEFVDETVELTLQYGTQMRADYGSFRRMLDEIGPRLGWPPGTAD
jgi:uncharacterized protein (DUF2252 family)